MSKSVSEKDALELTDVIIKGMQEVKGKEIICMDLREVNNSICDFFVVCHGDSSTQVEAIADSIAEETRKSLGEKPWHREGINNAEWILLDYVNVVAHVFYNESREFYNLEALWADAKISKIEYQV